MKTSTFSIAALIILGLILIGVGPVLTIISLNALFALNIGITFWNYLAVVWLVGFGAVITGKKFN